MFNWDPYAKKPGQEKSFELSCFTYLCVETACAEVSWKEQPSRRVEYK